MVQPAGKTCGFDASLRTYIRSSPIVCVFDAALLILRFVIYICRGLSPPLAARRVLAARHDNFIRERPKAIEDVEQSESFQDAEQPQAMQHQNIDQSERLQGIERTTGIQDVEKPGGIHNIEEIPALRFLCLVVMMLPQIIKLLICSGIPWEKIWACCWLADFAVMEALGALAKSAKDKPDTAKGDALERLLAFGDKLFGVVAVLLQIFTLAYVDLAAIPPDRNIPRRWKFRMIRLSAHLIPVIIYLPLIISQSGDLTRSFTPRAMRSLVTSMIVINIVLTILLSLNFRFSHMYFMWSLIISMVSLALFCFPLTRKHFLLCRSGDNGYRHVLVFDFFLRILCFSLFWYIWYYDPEGTSKPKWAEWLG